MKNDENEIEPVASEPRLPSDASFSLVAERLVDQARTDGVSLADDGGLLTCLLQRVLQGAVDTEITDHLEYETHSSDVWGSGTSDNVPGRHSQHPKTVVIDVGDVLVVVPRDRNGSFEPQTVPVGSRRMSDVDAQIISLYARGLDRRHPCLPVRCVRPQH